MMADANSVSLAVWDVPMPVVAGEPFSIKAGATARSRRVEVCDPTGTVVASGTLGATPWPGTEALYWVTLDVPPPKSGRSRYTVRCDGAESWFNVIAAAKPGHRLTLRIAEQDTAEPLADVEIRLGPFHARTDRAGEAQLSVCAGAYQLHVWRTAHIASPMPVTIDRDTTIELTMRHVPEEHPDARWVR